MEYWCKADKRQTIMQKSIHSNRAKVATRKASVYKRSCNGTAKKNGPRSIDSIVAAV